MDRIRAVMSAELLRLPGSLCHDLANREPRYIQQVLDPAFRSSLERLSRPETYVRGVVPASDLSVGTKVDRVPAVEQQVSKQASPRANRRERHQ